MPIVTNFLLYYIFDFVIRLNNFRVRAHRSLKTLNTLEFQKSVFKALENLEFFTSP